ncbi:MAG: 4Fe-4S binding protein [Deltaproteobacteria bacterium]|nr:4Fe-4S binding protein [Deltaproteobacteria bacterium]
MIQLGFYFDQTRCTGCYACVVACKDWHDIDHEPVKWMRVTSIEYGKFPDLFAAYMTSPCYHCSLSLLESPLRAGVPGRRYFKKGNRWNCFR